MDELIGSRGKSALNIFAPYIYEFFKCLDDAYDPITNPGGYIAICVAENKLIQERLTQRMLQPKLLEAAFADRSVYFYNSFLGLPPAREAVAKFLTRKFLCSQNKFEKLSNDGETGNMVTVKSEHVALSSGCASFINLLATILAEEGDAALIPAPYYAGFESDISAIAKCVPFPVVQKDPSRGPTAEELEAAAKSAEDQGLTVKLLVLCNPNNPLGVTYEPAVIKEAISWARGSRNIHTIVDEIYALSVHRQDSSSFHSVLEILDNQLGNDVHMIWALSKDFGSSGFRIGVLCTQNDMLLRAIENLNVFSGVSHPMQLMVAEILLDEKFVDSYLSYSSSILLKSYNICKAKLEEMAIPYIPADSGMFVYCDFSSLLPSPPTFEGENRLVKLMSNIARIVMTPGECQRDPKPGMFRICYAWNDLHVLELAMERIKFLKENILEIGWDGLEASTLSFDDFVPKKIEIL